MSTQFTPETENRAMCWKEQSFALAPLPPGAQDPGLPVETDQF